MLQDATEKRMLGSSTLNLVSSCYLDKTELSESASACAAGLAGSACKAVRAPTYIEKSPYRASLVGMLPKSNEELIDKLVRALASSLKL